ncbi:MAG: hypothetical protein ACRYGP_30215 [Janthinobacterium lividum]
MTHRPFHRPLGTRLVEIVGLVKLSSRKALQFAIVEENGVRLGEILHVGLTPSGRPTIPERPQRMVMAEPVAARIVEAAAGIGVKLREARS